MDRTIFVELAGRQVPIAITANTLGGDPFASAVAAQDAAEAALAGVANKVDTDLSNGVVVNPQAPAIIRGLLDKLRDAPNAFDAIPATYHNAIEARTATTAVSGFIQEGIEAFGALNMNAGLYPADSSISATTDRQALRGAGGSGATEIRALTGGFPLVSTSTKSNFFLQDVTLSKYVGTTTDGSVAMKFSDSHFVGMRGVVVLGTFQNQLVLEGGPNQYLYVFDAYSLEALSQEAVTVGKVGGVVQEVFMGDGAVVGGSQSAFSFYDASGFYPGTISLLGGTDISFDVFPAPGQVVRYILGGRFVCDSSASEAVRIRTNGGVVESWDTAIWGSSSYTSDGIKFDEGSGTIDNLKISLQGYNSEKAGINMVSGSRYKLSVQVGRNSREGSALWPNIFVGSGVRGATITGVAADVGSSTFSELANYAVIIDAGAEDVHLLNLDMRGAVTGPIVNLGTRTIIRDCLGCRTTAYSVEAILAGNTTANVVVPIDLPLVRGKIRLQKIDADSSFPGGLWASAVVGQTATISLGSPAPTNAFFALHVDQSEA